MKRKATAVWNGAGKEGSGKLSTTSGVMENVPYSFMTRFENEDGKAGTNPEELIAAAHAGCFNMALSFTLSGEGYEVKELHTEATVRLKKVETGFQIDHILLALKGRVKDIEESTFQELAKKAKENCPVSKALSAVKIDLEASLV